MTKDEIYEVIITLKSNRATKLDGQDKILLNLNDEQKKIIAKLINESVAILKDKDGEFVGYCNNEEAIKVVNDES